MGSERNKLFVGGISRETSEEDLKQHFSKYGAVLGAVVATPRCFGFVLFSDSASADKALQDRHTILGQVVDVRKAVRDYEDKTQQPRQSGSCNGSQVNNMVNGETSNTDRRNKIFVGGLPSTLTTEEFTKYFEQFGRVTDGVVMRNKENHQPRGFGFVTFESEESVQKAIQNRFHKLNNKLVEVKRAIPKNETQNSNTSNSGNYFGSGGGSVYQDSSHHVQNFFQFVGSGTPICLPPSVIHNGGYHIPPQIHYYHPWCNSVDATPWNNHNVVMSGPLLHNGYHIVDGSNTNGSVYNPNANFGLYGTSRGMNGSNTNSYVYNPNVNFGLCSTSGEMNGVVDGPVMTPVWNPRPSVTIRAPNSSVQYVHYPQVYRVNDRVHDSDRGGETNGRICNLEAELTITTSCREQNEGSNDVGDSNAESCREQNEASNDVGDSNGDSNAESRREQNERSNSVGNSNGESIVDEAGSNEDDEYVDIASEVACLKLFDDETDNHTS